MQVPGTHGENGASAQHHAATDLDGGIEFARILETANIALVILLRLKFARQLIVKVCFVHIHFLQAIQPFFSLHKRSRAVKNLFTSISMSMLLTSEVEASSLSGRALLLQQGQGHPLSPLLNPSLLLRSQPYRDVTPTSRNACCECNKGEPGKMRWIEQSLNQVDHASQEKPPPQIPHQWISLTTPSPFPPTWVRSPAACQATPLERWLVAKGSAAKGNAQHMEPRFVPLAIVQTTPERVRSSLRVQRMDKEEVGQ